MHVFITGSTGFVGRGLKQKLYSHAVTSSSRSGGDVTISNIDGRTRWLECLKGVDVVVHCAARVHVMTDEVEDPLAAYRETNVEGTANLARQAAKAGVKRFIFLSSIKVNGEFTIDSAFRHDDVPNPGDAYAQSKFEAEEALIPICQETGMEYVIIRPPLVYGPSVKANFLTMLNWVSRGVPLPLGAVDNNRRSLVYLYNLVDLVRVCINHEGARNQTFLVSDDCDVSTRVLLERLAKALGCKSRLISVPLGLLGVFGRLLGKKGVEKRLSSSLAVDISHTKKALDWRPPYSLEQGLKKTAYWYKSQKSLI